MGILLAQLVSSVEYFGNTGKLGWGGIGLSSSTATTASVADMTIFLQSYESSYFLWE